MSTTSPEKFRRAVWGNMQSEDGLVLDVRFNGGGSIAAKIFAILQARVFSPSTMRGDPVRQTAPLQDWVKPAIVLANEPSASSAEVFAWASASSGGGRWWGLPRTAGSSARAP